MNRGSAPEHWPRKIRPPQWPKFDFRSGLVWSKILFTVCSGRSTPMCRIRFVISVIAFTVPAWSACQAVGSFQTKPAFPKVVTAGFAPPLPTITLPDVSARDLVGGCGRGRIRDHHAHGCRGPADIR